LAKSPGFVGKVLFLALLMVLSMVLISYNHFVDDPPGINIQELVRKAVQSYRAKGIDFHRNLIDYQPLGSYLHFEDTAGFDQSMLKRDSEGIPLVKHDNGFHYNPVTVAQYALFQYGKFLRKQASLDDFTTVADKLLDLQESDGSFRYSFTWHYYLIGTKFKTGWVSAMAQGQALSVLARAYAFTKDNRYWEAGNKAFKFLLTPVAVGGVMDNLGDLNPNWKRYVTFELYPVKPASYTLNGFMFTLLGCYDWWQLDPGASEGSCKTALAAFTAGIKTLDLILKYYDIGGFASYDLGYIIYQARPNLDPFYFAVDIYLLHALYSITGNENLRKYELLWASYVNK
jgi:hypothetical protein